MVRTILLGAVVTAAALASAPSASADEICVHARATQPAALNTGYICTAYPSTTCTAPSVHWDRIQVDTYICVPSILSDPERS